MIRPAIHTLALLTAFAGWAATLLSAAGAQEPEPVAEAAIVVELFAPPLVDADGSAAAGVEERLVDIAATLAGLDEQPLAGLPKALAVSPVLCQELTLLSSPAAGEVLDRIRAMAAAQPVLLSPHAHLRLAGLDDSEVRRELEAGAAALEACTQRPSADVLFPPDGHLDETALTVAQDLGVRAALAGVASPQTTGRMLLLPSAAIEEIDDLTEPPDAAVVTAPAERSSIERLGQLFGEGAIRATLVDEVLEEAPAGRLPPASEQAQPSSSYLRALARAEAALSGLESYTLEDNPRAAVFHTVLARARSSAEWDDFSEGTRRCRRLLEVLEAERRLVRLTNGDITFTSQVGSVPVTVSNDAAYPVRVLVNVDSAKLDFPSGNSLEVVVPPPGETITFDAIARTTGTFPTTVTISSPDGSLTLDAAELRVRSVAANLTGIVLTAGGALFLLVWTIRRWRRRRRASATELPATSTTTGPASGTAGD